MFMINDLMNNCHGSLNGFNCTKLIILHVQVITP